MKPIVHLLLHVKKARSALDRGRKADTKQNNSSRHTVIGESKSSTSV